MKRLTTLLTAFLLCTITFAQQALWGNIPVVSPEIHDNNTVTFRLQAPKAVKVQVTGDFLPKQKIKRRMGSLKSLGLPNLRRGKQEYGNIPLQSLYSRSFIVTLS